ncbi:hypothetical protein HanPI659440_Chr12g0466941 [Helianthus annuus]|nr:hypothetical protein HanHA300_Chr12g0450021 [Helianthus annuus]KAJ0675555.1 hypothetical protein HanLR1_Chr12g0452491 [Helianthus annuus]KAJ0678834.1 hypothetical protein HanOQP8_Chr12g0452381 [Helianthus annuus]KAJ0726144.1 hypothetical protein HanPI659440_Chr12g0466941 [Helianthus annuus]
MSCFRSHYHHARDKYIDCRRCQSQRLILLTPASKALTISPDTLAIASAAFCFSAPARMIIDKLREDKQRFTVVMPLKGFGEHNLHNWRY